MSKQRLSKPTSIRFTHDERVRVDEMTQTLGVSFSELVRLRLFSRDFEKSYQMLTMRKAERLELAHILAALGESRIANNLNQIAYACNTGSLVISHDVIAQLNEAYDTVMWIRKTLILHLGVRS